MGYVAKDFKVERFNLPVPNAYGALKHLELDIPMGICRMDLHWYPDKETSLTKTPAFDVWSYPVPAEMIAELFKENGNKAAFALAYEWIRKFDPRMEKVDDEMSVVSESKNEVVND